MRLKVREFLANTRLEVIWNNTYLSFGLKVLSALRRADKVKDEAARQAVGERGMLDAYHYAQRHLPNVDYCDQVRDVVIEAYLSLTKR